MVENLPKGEVELHLIAWNTDAGPLDLRLSIPDAPKTIERDFTLPAGLIVTGRVADQDAGAGIGGAELNFRPRPEPGRIPSYFGFRTTTELDGRFRMVVSAGRGTVEIWKLPPAYLDPLSYATGPNADPHFKLEFSGKPGDTVRDLTFRLEPGKVITLIVLDPEGEPVAGAEVHRRNRTSSNEAPGRTNAAGQCELTGVDRTKGVTVDVIHPSRPLGPAWSSGPTIPTPKKRDTRSKSSSSAPPRLPVGLSTRKPSYYVHISADGHASSGSERIRAKPGEIHRLNEFRLPVADQELRGIVVDPRGQPVTGAIVGFRRTGDRQLTAPRSGRWFEETDGQGRFHLTTLPRGPLKLTAYRKPEGADRSIRNLVRVDARASAQGNELRIVLPDANERLRGIE
jgi:hypothetical protein